jgi:hypothetical protein
MAPEVFGVSSLVPILINSPMLILSAKGEVSVTIVTPFSSLDIVNFGSVD